MSEALAVAKLNSIEERSKQAVTLIYIEILFTLTAVLHKYNYRTRGKVSPLWLRVRRKFLSVCRASPTDYQTTLTTSETK